MHKIYRIVRDFSTQLKKQNISAFAASTAFFIFLSLVPMLIMVCTLIPYTPLTEENLVMVITDFTPNTIDPLVNSMISSVYEKSTGVLSIALITTIWSAGKGVLALMRGLNAVNGVEEKRNYFVVRIVSSFYTIIMLIVIILSLFIMVFGNRLVELILYRFPPLKLLVSFIMNFRFLLTWVILTLFFGMIYTYIPDKKLHFWKQIPGAAFAAVVWTAFSWCFSIYIDHTDSYNIYGSLSIVVTIMIWMYFCMYIVMIGACLNTHMKWKTKIKSSLRDII